MTMRVLVGWDNPDEATLLEMYLNVDGLEATFCETDECLYRQSREHRWDAVLLAINERTWDASYDVFSEVRRLVPDCPVVCACPLTEMYRLAKFLTRGMRSYIPRDASGDYMFIICSTITAIIEAVRAEREQLIAERLREEISSVRKLQESIIPRDLQGPPGYHVCARYEPSQIRVFGGQPVVLAGGDYYDVVTLDDRYTVIMVGDASGHGMRACMSIMTMHTLMTMRRGERFRDPATFVSTINRQLCEQAFIQETGGFITVLYGILDAETNEFLWASAGHPIPLIQDVATGRIEPLATYEAGGLPLCLYEDAEYETQRTPIPPGSRLLVYTDGLIEAFVQNEAGTHEEFGLAGVSRTLRQCTACDIHQTLDSLFHASSEMTNGQGRHDDTSIVLLERSA